jgi:O-acetyl-ADP-ribose deacetylase (regulator of RNase III)
MITYTQGDIFDQNVKAIVNAVNCVGIMGKGLALQFKKKYPENFELYETACRQKRVVPGKMFICEISDDDNSQYIINFPTKRHWRDSSLIEDIILGLDDLAKTIKALKIESIAIPPIGCGLGGLEWTTVKSHIENKLSNLTDVQIIVLEPKN